MKTQIKNNKALFILPLGLLPFVILIFYFLGGGGGQATETLINNQNGANYQLPDANRDITILDKKEAYRLMDEETPMEALQLNVDTTQNLSPLELTKNVPAVNVNEVLMAHVKKQEQLSREALYGKTQNGHLEAVIKSEKKYAQTIAIDSGSTNNKRTGRQAARRKIEAQDQPVKESSIELEEISELLDEHERIIRQKDSLQKQLQKAQVRSQQNLQKQAGFEVQLKTSISFEQATTQTNSIRAQIVEDTKVLTGNRVMMRLMSDTQIHGKTIRKGTLIYGLCKTDNERLQLLITSLPFKDSFLPVSLSAYDLDGIKGLYVPDNVNRKVYKDVAGDVNPSFLFTPADNPLSYMGVNAAADLSKTMIKRVRLKRVYFRKIPS